MSQKDSQAIASLLHRLLLLDTEPEVVATKTEEEIDAGLRAAGIDPDPIIARVMQTVNERPGAETSGQENRVTDEFLSLGDRMYSLERVDKRARVYRVVDLQSRDLYNFVNIGGGIQESNAEIVTIDRRCVLMHDHFASVPVVPLELRLQAQSRDSQKRTQRAEEQTLFLRYEEGEFTVDFLTDRDGEVFLQLSERG